MAGANQLVHALRARGVQTGDPFATLMSNSAELLQVLLAVFQAGWQYVPINTHLTADEVAYILADSGAKAFVADERYADVAGAAAETAAVPAAARLAVGAIPGFVPLADALAEQPDRPPADRVAGGFMQYTSGTDRATQSRATGADPLDPETQVVLFGANLTRYDIELGGDSVHLVTSPMYHMSPLSFGYFSLHFEHTVVLMERWDAERRCN